MIIVKEIKNDKNFSQCIGCGEVENTYTHIQVKNIGRGTEKYLTLCPTCKTTLIRELLCSQHPGDFEDVKNELEGHISMIELDIEDVKKRWINKFGVPFTKERVLKYEKNPISMEYLNFIRMIEDCERILSVIQEP